MRLDRAIEIGSHIAAWMLVGLLFFLYLACVDENTRLELFLRVSNESNLELSKKLEENGAKVATSRCGDKKFVFIRDHKQVAVAGMVVEADSLDTYSFEEKDGSLTVKRSGRIVMIRPQAPPTTALDTPR